MENVFIRNNGGVKQVYKLVDTKVNELVNSQNKMHEDFNVMLGIAGKVTFF
jgi:hypothetical protein